MTQDEVNLLTEENDERIEKGIEIYKEQTKRIAKQRKEILERELQSDIDPQRRKHLKKEHREWLKDQKVKDAPLQKIYNRIKRDKRNKKKMQKEGEQEERRLERLPDEVFTIMIRSELGLPIVNRSLSLLSPPPLP